MNYNFDYSLEEGTNPTIDEKYCKFTEHQIRFLISKRLEFKKGRKFEEADKILMALNENGIYVQDKPQRKYRVDGKNYFGKSRRKDNIPKYVQRGGNYWLENSNTKEKDRSSIEELLEERTECKRRRDFDQSDFITEELKHQYGVKVNDKKREWTIDPEFGMKKKKDEKNKDEITLSFLEKQKQQKDDNVYYVPTPLATQDHITHTMEDASKDIIRNKLKERSIARKNKDYKKADRILNELTIEFNILVDDRTKEWKVIDPSSEDNDDMDDPFVQEAKLSQRSAFVQTKSNKNNNKKRKEEYYYSDDEDYNDNNNYDYDRPSFSSSSRSSSNNTNKRFDQKERKKKSVRNENREALFQIAAAIKADNKSINNEGTTTTTSTTLDEEEDQELNLTTPISNNDIVVVEENVVQDEETTTTITTTEIESSSSSSSSKNKLMEDEEKELLSTLTVVKLKEKLRSVGLPVSGRKSELIDRLLGSH